MIRISKTLLPILLATVLIGGCATNKKDQPTTKPYAFWPQYPDEPRVQFIASYDASSDIAPQKSKMDQLIFGKEPEESAAVKKPYGVKMWNGRIYLCDLRASSIMILDLRKQQTLIMGRGGTDPLLRPSDITISADGYKYVADNARERVFVFDPDDRYVTSFGADMKPVGIATAGDELYVCDFKSQRVLVLNRHNGTLLRTIGQPGGDPGQFIRPLGIAVDADGNIYVADVMTCRIQKFSPDGKLLLNFGTISANTGGLVRPKQIAVDREGLLYVVDAAFQNVQIFDQQGRVLTFFGSPGEHPGAMNLPAGISVHEGDLDLFKKLIHPSFQAERLILVTNQFGDNKVSVYAFGHPKPGASMADFAASRGVVPTGTMDPSKLPGKGPTTGSTSAPSDPDSPVPGNDAAPTPTLQPGR